MGTIGMKLVRVWDYFMRRKPLLAGILVILASIVLGCNFLIQQRKIVSENVAELGVVQTIDNGLELVILDKSQVQSYRMTFSDGFMQANIETGTGCLMSETYVRIFDTAGNLVTGDYTVIDDSGSAEVQYYFQQAPKNYSVALTPGMRIELRAENAQFYSTLDGVEVAEFVPQAESENYLVTADGLRRMNWSDEQVSDVMYRQIKRHAEQQISQYQQSIPDYILYNRTLDIEKKARIIYLYTKLLPGDQENYREFVEQLRRGGVPTITYRGALEYKMGAEVDLLELVDVHDNEDGEIAIDKVIAEGAVDFSTAGSYDVAYSVTDSDGNTTRLALTIVILEEQFDTPNRIPHEDRPIDMPSDVNGPIDTSTGDTNAGTNTAGNMGFGAGVSSDITEGVQEAVWGAPEIKVDHESIILADQASGDGGAGETARQTDSWTSTKQTDMNATESTTNDSTTNSTATNRLARLIGWGSEDLSNDDTEKQERDGSWVTATGTNLLLIGAGLLILCGFVKFIFDHYVRWG